MRTYEVWSEGYRATGESGGAVYHGSYQAETFKDACIQAARRFSNPSLFDPKRLTYWGCKLFSSEEEARESFG